MTTIGIDLDGNEAIFIILTIDANGTVTEKISGIKKIELKNDTDCSEVKQFKELVHSHFDTICPDKIGIIKRNSKGQKSASPMSFKLEGLIQCYAKKDIAFVHPATIKAFLKRRPITLQPKHKYQIPALELAYHLLFN